MKKILLIICILCLTSLGWGQTYSVYEKEQFHFDSLGANYIKTNFDKLLNHASIQQDTFKLKRIQADVLRGERMYVEAFESYYTCITDNKYQQSKYEKGMVLMGLGLVFKQFEEHALAIKFYRESRTHFKGEHLQCGRTYFYEAISNRSLKNFEEAKSNFKKALQDFTNANSVSFRAKVLNSIGIYYKQQKNLDSALHYSLNAMSIYEEYNLQHKSKVYNNVGNVYSALNQLEKAESYYNLSMDLKVQEKDSLGIGILLHNKAKILQRKKAYKEVIKTGKQALDVWVRTGRKNKFGLTTLKIMAESYEELNDTKNAIATYKLIDENTKLYHINEDNSKLQLYENKNKINFHRKTDSLRNTNLSLAEEIKKVNEEKDQIQKEKSNIVVIALITGVVLLSLIIIILITKTKRANEISEELRSSNELLKETQISKEEKEVLLQEIHHRVKNNMQIISSLIRLQSRQFDDNSIESAFSEMQDRIKSMSLVHEQLYQTKNFQNVSTKEYIEQLVVYLIRNYSLDKDVTYNLDVSINKVKLDTVIPLGLIVNEIISNSLKHAFTKDQKCNVYVKFHFDTELDTNILTIGDNGEQDNSQHVSEGLGMELIDALVGQLDGTYILDKTQGYVYEITF